MIESAQGEMLERRTSEEDEAAKQEAQRLIAEIDRLFPQVEQIVASSDFGRDAIGKARGIVDRTRQSIQKKDMPAVREQIESLARTHRMFKGVVSRPH